MIAHVSGKMVEKFGSSLIVDVGGVGYEVVVARGDFDASILGEPLKLYTHHHIREQAQELYGFSSLAAKKLFEMLITVQGVGPKAALSILSLADHETIRSAIAGSDSAYLSKASGVGKRIAERVAVDLSDKVGLPTAFRRSNETVPMLVVTDEALEALMALGYNLGDASDMLRDVPIEDLTTAERVRLALKTR